MEREREIALQKNMEGDAPRLMQAIKQLEEFVFHGRRQLLHQRQQKWTAWQYGMTETALRRREEQLLHRMRMGWKRKTRESDPLAENVQQQQESCTAANHHCSASATTPLTDKMAAAKEDERSAGLHRPELPPPFCCCLCAPEQTLKADSKQLTPSSSPSLPWSAVGGGTSLAAASLQQLRESTAVLRARRCLLYQSQALQNLCWLLSAEWQRLVQPWFEESVCRNFFDVIHRRLSILQRRIASVCERLSLHRRQYRLSWSEEMTPRGLTGVPCREPASTTTAMARAAAINSPADEKYRNTGVSPAATSAALPPVVQMLRRIASQLTAATTSSATLRTALPSSTSDMKTEINGNSSSPSSLPSSLSPPTGSRGRTWTFFAYPHSLLQICQLLRDGMDGEGRALLLPSTTTGVGPCDHDDGHAEKRSECGNHITQLSSASSCLLLPSLRRFLAAPCIADGAAPLSSCMRRYHLSMAEIISQLHAQHHHRATRDASNSSAPTFHRLLLISLLQFVEVLCFIGAGGAVEDDSGCATASAALPPRSARPDDTQAPAQFPCSNWSSRSMEWPSLGPLLQLCHASLHPSNPTASPTAASARTVNDALQFLLTDLVPSTAPLTSAAASPPRLLRAAAHASYIISSSSSRGCSPSCTGGDGGQLPAFPDRSAWRTSSVMQPQLQTRGEIVHRRFLEDIPTRLSVLRRWELQLRQQSEEAEERSSSAAAMASACLSRPLQQLFSGGDASPAVAAVRRLLSEWNSSGAALHHCRSGGGGGASPASADVVRCCEASDGHFAAEMTASQTPLEPVPWSTLPPLQLVDWCRCHPLLLCLDTNSSALD